MPDFCFFILTFFGSKIIPMFTFVAQPYPCRYLITHMDKRVFNIADMECHMYISWVVFYCLMLMLDPKCCEANSYMCLSSIPQVFSEFSTSS